MSDDQVRFAIPLPGKGTAVILLPGDLAMDEWDLVDTVAQALIAHLARRRPALVPGLDTP